eukprot:TRINITY_DN25814_c0_g1_i1.p1 TRINITY_DN25814_c0_g1~~TRINITY_DN25814_c0_g1_i1.p1  ORF type:complete len:431 (-),score=78.70 TRINITY_DN25814_c0_g1_i1:136-1428(-)
MAATAEPVRRRRIRLTSMLDQQPLAAASQNGAAGAMEAALPHAAVAATKATANAMATPGQPAQPPLSLMLSSMPSRSRSRSRSAGGRTSSAVSAPSVASSRPKSAVAGASGQPAAARRGRPRGSGAAAKRAEVRAACPVQAAAEDIAPPLLAESSYRWEEGEFEVREASNKEEKQAAFNLIIAKNTFQDERELVKYRIHSGPQWQCRTWLLAKREEPPVQNSGTAVSSTAVPSRGPPGSSPDEESSSPRAPAGGAEASTDVSVSFVAAVIVRLNPYLNNRPGMWGQILNIAARRERCGFGVTLVGGVEELLKREFVDVLALYPASNGRAPKFWIKVGFSPNLQYLPPPEVIPNRFGGPLLTEIDPMDGQQLPRWEKRLQLLDMELYGRAPTVKRIPNKVPSHRFVAAHLSRISGKPLQAAKESLLNISPS